MRNVWSTSRDTGIRSAYYCFASQHLKATRNLQCAFTLRSAVDASTFVDVKIVLPSRISPRGN